VEGDVRPRQGGVAGCETHWVASNLTWRQQGLERAGSASGGCAAGARKREEWGARVEEDDEGVKSQFCARCAVKKGGARPLALNVGPTASAKCLPACTCPDEIGARPRDTSIPAEPGSLRHPHAVISNRHVHHEGRDARTSRFIRTNHVTHAIHVAHDDHGDPCGAAQDCNGYNEV
jgi:hypothetical protein